MNMKKILLALGVGAIGYFLWKKFSKKSDSTTKSFSGNDDFFSADGKRVLRNGGYYAFSPKNLDGYYPLSPRTKMLGLNKDKINSTTLKITNQINGRYYDFNGAKNMGYTNVGLQDGIIVIAFPIRFKGLVVPSKDFTSPR